MSSLRAPLPSASQAKGDGRRAVPVEGQLEQARRHGVAQHGQHARQRRRVEVGVEQIDEQVRHIVGGLHEIVLVARSLDRAAQGERAAGIEGHEVAGRQDTDHRAVAVEHRHMVHAGRHHGDARLGREHLGVDRVDRRRHDRAHRRLGGDAADDDLVAKVDVGHDAETVAQAHQDRRAALGFQQLGRLADGRVGLAEDRLAAHQRGDRPVAHVGQRPHGAGRLNEALALIAGQPLTPVGRHSRSIGRRLGDAVERRLLARSRGEFGRQAGEQRRVTEDLAGGDQGDEGFFVQHLERALAHHEQLRARHAAFDQHRLARGHDALDDRARQVVELGGGQPLEGFDARQEPGPVLELLGVDRER